MNELLGFTLLRGLEMAVALAGVILLTVVDLRRVSKSETLLVFLYPTTSGMTLIRSFFFWLDRIWLSGPPVVKRKAGGGGGGLGNSEGATSVYNPNDP